jgi:hypothetical protein
MHRTHRGEPATTKGLFTNNERHPELNSGSYATYFKTGKLLHKRIAGSLPHTGLLEENPQIQNKKTIVILNLFQDLLPHTGLLQENLQGQKGTGGNLNTIFNQIRLLKITYII